MLFKSEILYFYFFNYFSSGFTYFFGLPVVTFLDPPKLNLSPLPDHAGVLFVCTPEELVTVLHSLVLAPSFAPYSP